MDNYKTKMQRDKNIKKGTIMEGISTVTRNTELSMQYLVTIPKN